MPTNIDTMPLEFGIAAKPSTVGKLLVDCTDVTNPLKSWFSHGDQKMMQAGL